MAPCQSRTAAAQAHSPQNDTNSEDFNLEVSRSDSGDEGQPAHQSHQHQGPVPATKAGEHTTINDPNPTKETSKTVAVDIHYFFKKVEGKKFARSASKHFCVILFQGLEV